MDPRKHMEGEKPSLSTNRCCPKYNDPFGGRMRSTRKQQQNNQKCVSLLSFLFFNLNTHGITYSSKGLCRKFMSHLWVVEHILRLVQTD